jgi:transposase InsO family protein
MGVTTKIIFMSYLYLIYFIAVLVYPNYLQRTQANDSSYVPKSQRTYLMIWAYLMIAWFEGQWDTLANKIEGMQLTCRNKRKIRKSKRVAAIMQLPPENKYKGRIFVAFAALAMQAQGARAYENSLAFDTDSGPIGIDNRCTACISHRIEDFEGQLIDSNRFIKGFGGARTTNVKMGTIRWKWLDDKGQEHKFLIPKSYYVPDGNVRLLSPQHWGQAINAAKKKDKQPLSGTGSETVHNKVTLFWNQRKNRLTVPLGSSNVATFQLAPGYSKFNAFCAEAEVDYEKEQEDPIIIDASEIVPDDEDDDDIVQSGSDTTDETDWCQPVDTEFDLNGPEKARQQLPNYIDDEEDQQPTSAAAELLQYHHRFGHISFRRLQEMARQRVIPKRLAKCPVPACSACLYAKAIKRQWRHRTPNNVIASSKPTKPGERISVDQMVSPTPGLIAQMTGILTTKRYAYATIYVDQVSRLSFVWLQKTATAEETVEGKIAFEKYALDRGVKVLNYHADNGVFRAHKWVDACRSNGQGLSFAGVNAHHQNGMAERRIGELQSLARTMLIHANKRWPKVATANLWPYAIRMANDVLNEAPSLRIASRKSPLQVFADTNVNPNAKHWKPFGCPVYVLDSALQQGKIHHKWKQRSRVGIYIGRSPQHARNVALVLNIQTGLVSPQFHVKFDPSFHTVKQSPEMDSLWQIKAGFVAQREHLPEKVKEVVTRPSEGAPTGAPEPKRPRLEAPVVPTVLEFNRSPPNEEELNKSELNKNVLQHHDSSQKNDSQERQPTIAPAKTLNRASTLNKERTRRKRQPVERLIEAMTTEISQATSGDVEGEIFCLQAICPGNLLDEMQDPIMAYKATSDPDTMYLHQAMKEPDKKQFVEAMQKEVRDQMENGNFTVMHKSKLPKGSTVLPAVWQMKRKRHIKTRKVKKHKARLNIDGSRMKKGIHYDETYAPVASWNSIRLLLTLTAVHKWHTKQLDFVLAFPQAPVDREIYMKIPKGFDLDKGDSEDYVLKLHKNVYGQKQAGRVWNKYLVNKLVKELKFVQSKTDECVFYRGSTMYVLYTDDSILAGPDETEINQIIKEMKQAKLDITVEGGLEDFLGINIDRQKDGTINLTQPHLIDQILKDLRLEDENVTTKDTPASSSKILRRHTDSAPFDGSFNYRSVIGKLNYLEKGTRSDISYIVHQCARFSTDPKQEHAQALRWLGRYLKATRNRGTILQPAKGKDMEVYVDADFSGNWHAEESWDRDTARSRHGFIVMYAGCPILWKSQLQTEIALSSTESEYTGLSYALRDAIPIMELLKEMKELKFPIRSATPKVHCKIFEDNSGALEIASVHKFRPRTKHLNVKLHFFRDYIIRKEITVNPIHTSQQLADYLTKPVNKEILDILRPQVMGW